MCKTAKIYSLIIVMMSMFQQLYAQRGNLFIIGGGSRSEALIQDLVQTSDLRADDYIVILPMATSVPEESIAYISEQLRQFTDKKIVSFNFDKNKRMIN